MAEILTDSEVSEIEARENLATEGPWRTYYRVSPRGAHRKWHIGNETGLCQITMGDREQDYEFMAHSRTDIPRLIASHRTLAAERDRLKRGEFTPEEFQELCHNTGVQAGFDAFADGCEAYQQRLFGRCRKGNIVQ